MTLSLPTNSMKVENDGNCFVGKGEILRLICEIINNVFIFYLD